MSGQATQTAPAFDYNALRQRLESETGQTYWRSLNDLANTEAFDELVHREFPSTVSEVLDPVSRRNFIKLMGASMMMAGLANCARQPQEYIAPYVKQPEMMVHGKPMYYATAMSLAGYGLGVLAHAYEHRPIHVDGLAEHPATVGRSNLWLQASILGLYDPDRLDSVLYRGNISTWKTCAAAIATAMVTIDEHAGRGLHILTGNVTSPTLAWQMNKLRAQFPGAVWHQYEPAPHDNVLAGAQQAFGRAVETVYDFAQAQVIVSFDHDFLGEGPAQVRYTRDFAALRDPDGAVMNRLYVAEATPTITGANADHKLNVRYPHVEFLARHLAQRLGLAADVAAAAESDATLPEAWKAWVEAIAADLEAHRGAAVVTAGPAQPAAVHAICHALNERLGNVGKTVRHLEPVQAEPVPQMQSLKALADAVLGPDGAENFETEVDLLIILGANPVFDAPDDIDFEAVMNKLRDKMIVCLTQNVNETARLAHWAIPEAHYLESWGDVRAYDGTISIIQPLIQPLFGGRTPYEILALLLGEGEKPARDLVMEAWQARRGPDGFETFWRTALGTGIVADSAARALQVAANTDFGPHNFVTREGLDVVYRLDPSVYDGRFANNGWLLECPKPLTKLTWDNAIIMSPRTAADRGLATEDLVDLTVDGRTIRGPVLVQYGHPNHSITLHLGWGREYAGRVGTGHGFNVNRIRSSAAPYFASNASLAPAGGPGKYPLAITEDHYAIEMMTERAEKRHLFRESSHAFYQEHRDFPRHMGHHVPGPEFTMYDPEEHAWAGYRWGMAMDLSRCTGCNACVVACYSENNIPIVGKADVIKGREMSWIRIDRYYRGDLDDPQVGHMPMACQHCENAPCEPVCPVGATVHSNEGLNTMIYNRCIGTRYCANNCPYKVRRFNFFHYNIREGQDAQSLKMMRNPNVTVRSRGVMEKCTYCVQRINGARIEAKRENRRIYDGEVKTACQVACPADAILFGDLNDPKSVISRAQQQGRSYPLLGDIGTRPRTTYLAKVRNPAPGLYNPASEPHLGHGGDDHGGGHGGDEHDHEHTHEESHA